MNIRSVGLRGGHSRNCRGARGYVDEWETMQRLFPLVKSRLENRGVKVIDCNSNASTEQGELWEGTNKANSNKVDAYFTLHMNAFSNPDATGVECIVYEGGNKPINTIANNICINISNSLGLRNRGIKAVPKDHDVSRSNMPAIIIENGFCTNESDVNKIVNNLDRVAECIVNAIMGTSNNVASSPATTNNNGTIYRVRNASNNSSSQVGAYRNLDSARKIADEKGLCVWDGNTCIYSAIKADDEFNPHLRDLQDAYNKDFGAGIYVDGLKGPQVKNMLNNLCLRRGSKGNCVAWVQCRTGAKIDGDYGPETERKVREFQRNNGLTEDGVVGHDTLTKLLEIYK